MDENENRETEDAAQAFEALRAEVVLQRRAVEAMGDALEGHQAPDLSTDIAKILKGQDEVLKQVGALQAHPALKMTPAQHGEAIAQAGARAVREIERHGGTLAELVGVALTKRQQTRVLAWTAGAALAAGLVLSPLLIRVLLPVSAGSYVAAFAIGKDRWGGGAVLMQMDSPEGWSDIVEAANMAQANKGALAACKEAAAKARRDQRCTVTVAAPP